MPVAPPTPRSLPNASRAERHWRSRRHGAWAVVISSPGSRSVLRSRWVTSPRADSGLARGAGSDGGPALPFLGVLFSDLDRCLLLSLRSWGSVCKHSGQPLAVLEDTVASHHDSVLQGRLNLVARVRDASHPTGSLRRSRVYPGKVASSSGAQVREIPYRLQMTVI